MQGYLIGGSGFWIDVCERGVGLGEIEGMEGGKGKGVCAFDEGKLGGHCKGEMFRCWGRMESVWLGLRYDEKCWWLPMADESMDVPLRANGDTKREEFFCRLTLMPRATST